MGAPVRSNPIASSPSLHSPRLVLAFLFVFFIAAFIAVLCRGLDGAAAAAAPPPPPPAAAAGRPRKPLNFSREIRSYSPLVFFYFHGFPRISNFKSKYIDQFFYKTFSTDMLVLFNTFDSLGVQQHLTA